MENKEKQVLKTHSICMTEWRNFVQLNFVENARLSCQKGKRSSSNIKMWFKQCNKTKSIKLLIFSINRKQIKEVLMRDDLKHLPHAFEKHVNPYMQDIIDIINVKNATQGDNI